MMLSLRTLLLSALAVSAGVARAAECDEDFTINSDGDVDELASCTKFEGDLKLGKGVTSVTLPDTLQTITKDFIAEEAVNLVSLEAPGLQQIGGNFKLKGLTVLGTLRCPQLSSVGKIQWETLPGLKSLEFTTEISRAKSVLITDTMLTSLQGINLIEVTQFNVNNNKYLKEVDVALGNVSDSLTLAFNSKGIKASFPELVWANNITIQDAGELAFPSLQKINNSISFTNNTFEDAAFPKLKEVGQSFAFVSCIKLTNLTANNLKSVGGTFQLANNTKLEAVDGFKSLETVGGAVDMSGVFKKVDLPKLDDVRGGFNLQSTSDKLSCDNIDKLQGSVVKGTFTCEGGKETAESTSGGASTGGGSGDDDDDEEGAAGHIGANLGLAIFASVLLLAL